ncbi:MAG: hypothetical protein KDC44_24765, partial [Phaeodactylibacter sp.]|nr:hypothetical protein [Phaeodactylibacter sp.]
MAKAMKGMDRTLYKIVSLLLFGIFVVQQLSAQEYLINARRFTDAEGLSHNQVLALLQGPEGFLWISTKFGLNRFDGHQFRWFTKESHGLYSNQVSEIIEGPEGWLWLVYNSLPNTMNFTYEIELFHPRSYQVVSLLDKFKSIPFKISELEKILPFQDHQLLFTDRKGKHYYLNQKGNFITLPLPADFLAIRTKDKDKIWGTLNNQLLLLDREGNTLQSIDLKPGNTAIEVVSDHLNRQWIVSGELRQSKKNYYTVNSELSIWDGD